MLRRKFGNTLWLLIAIIVTVMFSGSFLFKKNPEQPVNVYYVTSVKTTARTTAGYFSASLPPVRHVTKSLSELGQMDEINQHVIFFNRIPNSGAEVLMFLLQKMQGFNNYRHVRLKGGDKRLSRIEQEEFVFNLYDLMRSEAVPLSFDRQMYFINFTSFDKQSPTFINLIREPADKFLSRSTSFLHQGREKCIPKKLLNTHELTVPYFCGHNPKCGSNPQWALQMAKNNVEKYYPVVGVLEELNATLEIMENKFTYFFKNVQKIYKKNILG